MTVRIVRGNALDLAAAGVADDSVDLVVTSPPYFGLRSYQDGGEHYADQIGSEATPGEFVDALVAATREMVRVVKPSGSIFVNLGDKYAGVGGPNNGGSLTNAERHQREAGRLPSVYGSGVRSGAPPKSLMGLPWRYALRCIDDLGLTLRAEIIWSKPNGLPESVTDRVRRSHEQWFHFTLGPRYFSAVDHIREEHAAQSLARGRRAYNAGDGFSVGTPNTLDPEQFCNPLGKLPGSVWTVPTQPLNVPAHLGVDHFAAFPMEWPRRFIRGWSPSGICVECGEGRRPVTAVAPVTPKPFAARQHERSPLSGGTRTQGLGYAAADRDRTITGEVCGCPDTTAPTTPGVVLDPFGGTGTTALVADVLGRHAIHVDLSSDYCRLAQWRTTDPGQRAAAMQVEKPDPAPEGIDSLFDLLDGAS